MKQLINEYAERLALALTLPAINEVPKLAEAFRLAWKNKQTIYICGNGGSAGNANASELLERCITTRMC